MEKQITDELAMIDQTILDILDDHRGHEKRISRDGLLLLINRQLYNQPGFPVRDRLMRTHIEQLRRKSEAGAWICSCLDGGYFLAESLQELDTYLNSEQSRLVHLAKKINRQRKVAGLPLSGQLRLAEEG